MTDIHANIRALSGRGFRPILDDGIDLRELIPGAESVHSPIRYSDPAWNFSGYPVVNQQWHLLDFRGVPPRWRHVVKDWVLLRLNPNLAESGRSGLLIDDVMAKAAAAETPIRVPSAFAYVAGLAVSLRVIDRGTGENLGPDDWESFARQLASECPKAQPVTLAGYARPLLSLWSYRGLFGLPDMFGGRPFGGRTPESVFGVPERGLNVERPAPEVCGPLLGLSLWIMDHCAEDILTRLETLSAIPDMTEQPRGEQMELVRQRLLEWERTKRPLPGAVNGDGRIVSPSWATFVRLAGCSSRALPCPHGEAKKDWIRLRQGLGVSASEDGFDSPVSSVRGIDGGLRPWIESMPPTLTRLGLRHWANTLVYCCALVIVVLTTVRDRELAAIPHDCLVEGTYERGDADVPVTRMRGFLVKNRNAAAATTWIVGDDVVRAVQIIRRLKAALRLTPHIHPQTGQEILLHPHLCGVRTARSTDSLQLSYKYLSWFGASGKYLADRELIAALPPLPAWLSHRTLRITGVEAYASQAWGDALAAAQAHWSNRTVAEGYFGHLPRSVFIADPESVEEVRQLDMARVLVDVTNDAKGGASTLAGNGVGRLDAVLAKEPTHELVTGPVTSRQLLQIAKNNPNVVVGEFTICVYGPGGLCGNESEAEFKLCRPFVCRNSATTQTHRARLELRRRSLAQYTGVFERARLKIEVDAPGIAAEFADFDDRALRTHILADLPGRTIGESKEGKDDE